MKTATALALVLVALGGCSTIGNMYDRWFGSRPAAKPAALVPITPTAQPRITWQGNVGAAERNMFLPEVNGKVVYAAGAAGQIAGFDIKTGNQTARFSAGQRLSGGVAASGSLVLVGTSRGE